METEIKIDPETVPGLMAWLKRRINECEKLITKHDSSDGYFGRKFQIQLQEARTMLLEELQNLKEQFPDVEPNSEALQPSIDSEEPQQVHDAMEILRSSYQKYEGNSGSETSITKLENRVAENEEYLRRLLEHNGTKDEYGALPPTQFGDWPRFARLFNRTANQRRSLDFIYQIARNCVDGDMNGVYAEKKAENIACLSNNDMSRAREISNLSVFSGKANIVGGAKEWLSCLQGPELHYDLALQNMSPGEYWFNFWDDVRVDKGAATYQRLYVGVKLLALDTVHIHITAAIIDIMRLVMDVLVSDDTVALGEDTAFVLARLIQLVTFIDCNDEGNVKVEHDTVKALACMKKACDASRYLVLEYVAAYEKRAGLDEWPEQVFKNISFRPQELGMDFDSHDFLSFEHRGKTMVRIRHKNTQTRWIVPAEALKILYRPCGVGGSKESQFRVQLVMESGHVEPDFQSVTFTDVFDSQAELEADLPDVEVQSVGSL